MTSESCLHEVVDGFFTGETSGVRAVERIRVRDRAGRWGSIVWFYTDPVGALVTWDAGGATKLTGRRFAELTAFAAAGSDLAA